jgi:hypothetical protein
MEDLLEVEAEAMVDPPEVEVEAMVDPPEVEAEAMVDPPEVEAEAMVDPLEAEEVAMEDPRGEEVVEDTEEDLVVEVKEDQVEVDTEVHQEVDTEVHQEEDMEVRLVEVVMGVQEDQAMQEEVLRERHSFPSSFKLIILLQCHPEEAVEEPKEAKVVEEGMAVVNLLAEKVVEVDTALHPREGRARRVVDEREE